MRRFRNPRFAPEGLERRLHPSGILVPAEISSPTSSISADDSAPDTASTYSADDAPPAPPVGTDPPVPPGDGTPPCTPPSLPGGPLH